jgi:hypothetical protein
VGERLELVGGLLDRLVALGHFFVGGCSPVAIRHTVEAARRATIVATAPIAP